MNNKTKAANPGIDYRKLFKKYLQQFSSKGGVIHFTQGEGDAIRDLIDEIEGESGDKAYAFGIEYKRCPT